MSSVLQVEEVMRRRQSGEDSFTVVIEKLALKPGQIVAVTGGSGTGKSTLLELVGLALAPERAGRFEIYDDGETIDLASLWSSGARDRMAGVRARSLGFVLQNGGLLPFLSARDNIELPRRLLGLPRRDPLDESVIGRLGIEGLLGRKPGQLSFGERQRVALARALSHRPKILLADEPTGALDPENADQVFDLLVELVRDRNISAVVVSHDVERVRGRGLVEVTPREIKGEQGPGSRFAAWSEHAT